MNRTTNTKYSLLIIASILMAVILSGCEEKAEPPFLTIDIQAINFNPGPSSRSINVKTNVENWTATVQPSAQSWINARPDGSMLKITVKENREAGTRQGEIKVVAATLTETITVEQLGKEPAILLSAESFTVSVDGGELQLEVTSNIEYDIMIPDETDWVNVKLATRLTEMVKKEYRIDVKWNSSDEERQAELVVKQQNGTLERKVFITQKAQEGYSGSSKDDIKDDIRVTVKGGKASSYQGGEEIEKSFDNDFSTIYHSNWNNRGTDYFPITLEYYFEGQESIDYLVYHPRPDGHTNGNFKEVEIWVATETEPTLKKWTDVDFKGSGSATRVTFEEPVLDPKTVRFVVKSGAGDGQGFASCSEMEFYRKNPENFNPSLIFSDLTCSKLKPGINLNDIKEIPNKLYRDIALYLFNGQYPSEFRIQEYRAWPHPDDWAKENKTSTLSLLDNPTGISISQGEDLIVFVGDTHGHSLSLKLQDLDKAEGDGYNNASFYPLSSGVNKLKPRNKGLGYIFYHTPDYKSAPPVKVHFATGEVNGYFDSQKHSASEWSRLLNGAVNKHFDLLGEYAHLTFETEAFRSHAKNSGPQLIDRYDDLVRLEQEFMGLMKYNRPTVNRAYFHVMYTSFMYATSYRTAYHASTQSTILNHETLKKSPWGPAHEMGHTLQTRPGFLWLGMTEVTNNVHSLYVQTQWGNPSRIESEDMGRYNNRYEKAYHNSFVKKTPHPGEEDVFCKLVSLWQLQLYFANAKGFTDMYKDFCERIRTSPNQPTPGEQQLDFVRAICDITETDLTRFFTRWGYLSPFDDELDDYGKRRFTVTRKQVDDLIAEIGAKNYAPVTEAIEYICDSNWQLFRDKLPVQKGTATKNGAKITMSGWKNVVAYKVYEGDNLVFVSNWGSFMLDNPATSNTKVYAVAYNGDKTEVKF